MVKSREKKLIIGTLILTIFGFVGKVLGAVFKIGLTAVVGSYGIGVYQLLFPVLVFFIVFSSEGFSSALTVRQAEHPEKGRSYFVLSIISSLVVSGVSFIMIMIISAFFANLQGVLIEWQLYLIVGVGVFIISLLSINKARIRGEERFVAYSLFETLEDVLKVVFALILAWILKPYGINGAVTGIFIGIVLSSFVTLIIICLYKPKNTAFEKSKLTKNDRTDFFKYSLLSMAGIIIIPAIQFIESTIVIRLMVNLNVTNVLATKLYGISRGSVSAIINLPFFLVGALEVLLLPNLSRSKNNGIYFKKTRICLFFAIALSLPFVLGFMMFSSEIVELLYGRSLTANELLVASNLLKIGAVGVLFASITSFLIVILNSNNKTFPPFIANLIGGVLKILFIVLMVPKLSIYAIELGSVLFSMVVCLVNLIFAIKYRVIEKPRYILLVTIFWFIVFAFLSFIYNILKPLFISNIISLLCSLLVAVLVICALSFIVFLFLKRKQNSTVLKD